MSDTKKDKFVVPEGTIKKFHYENGVRVIDDFSVSSLSLTDAPADPNLMPIEIIPNEDMPQ